MAITGGLKNFKSRSRDRFPTLLHFLMMPPVVNLSVKFDANVFIGDRSFITSPIWLGITAHVGEFYQDLTP